MSTTFGIAVPKSYQEPFEDPGIHKGSVYVEVAKRGGAGIRFLTPLAMYLDDEIKVDALDNSPQGIYTIGDIRQAIKKQNET